MGYHGIPRASGIFLSSSLNFGVPFLGPQDSTGTLMKRYPHVSKNLPFLASGAFHGGLVKGDGREVGVEALAAHLKLQGEVQRRLACSPVGADLWC